MATAIDMDYCVILIEKLINPLTPIDQIPNLLTELMASVPHPEMKKIATKIVDPSLDLAQKRLLMEEFKKFDHGGANDFSQVDYSELIDKFVDPNLPDNEYKPTMNALLNGDLDQDRKNMVAGIISCNDPGQKANMVKRFKSSFVKEKEEKEKAQKAIAEAAAARRAKKAEKEAQKKLEIPEKPLEFDDDGMTLIMRLINKKLPADMRTSIYERLMEPDIGVDVEVKNLAIQLTALTKFSLMEEAVKTYKENKELEKAEAIRLKAELEKKMQEEEEERKKLAMKKKLELEEKKAEKRLKMLKRDLMDKLKRPDAAMTTDEKELLRKEMEKMKEEMEICMKKITEGQERRNKEEEMKRKKEEEMNRKKEEEMKRKKEEEMKESLMEAPVVGNRREVPVPQTEEKDPDFDKYFAILRKPQLTYDEEKNHFLQLIKEKRKVLVKQLVIKMLEIGIGKSPLFKSLAKQYNVQSKEDSPNPLTDGNKENKTEIVEESDKNDGNKDKDNLEETKKDVEKVQKESSDDATKALVPSSNKIKEDSPDPKMEESRKSKMEKMEESVRKALEKVDNQSSEESGNNENNKSNQKFEGSKSNEGKTEKDDRNKATEKSQEKKKDTQKVEKESSSKNKHDSPDMRKSKTETMDKAVYKKTETGKESGHKDKDKIKQKYEGSKSDVEKKEKDSKELSLKKETLSNDTASNTEKEPDFDSYFKILSQPDITEEEEKSNLLKLIKEKRKVLVKQLVIKMSQKGLGRSTIFKSLLKQYNVNVNMKVDEPVAKMEVDENSKIKRSESDDHIGISKVKKIKVDQEPSSKKIVDSKTKDNIDKERMEKNRHEKHKEEKVDGIKTHVSILSETKDNSRDIKDGKKFSSAEVEKKRHNLESHNKSKDSKKVKLDDMVTKDLSAAPKLKDSEKLRNIESSRYEEVKSVIVVGSQKITKPVKSTDLRR